MSKKSSKVTILPCKTTLPVPPERILEGALASDLEEVMVVGWDKNGEAYLAGSTNKRAEAIVLLEIGKRMLVDEYLL